MSGLRTHHPVALIRGERGLEIDTHADELQCVLYLLNNGALGRGIKDMSDGGWGGDAHKAALVKVGEQLRKVAADIAEADKREAEQLKGPTA